jgi:CheY-like chemotaxis protein
MPKEKKTETSDFSYAVTRNALSPPIHLCRIIRAIPAPRDCIHYRPWHRCLHTPLPDATPIRHDLDQPAMLLLEPPMLRKNLRILLVEDHPFQLIALQIQLNNHGLYRVTPALNATEAMEALERSAEPYDLLLCDQRLPDMYGIELIRTASQRGLIRRAILLSGLDVSDLSAIHHRAKQEGLPLLGCLDKPLNAPALLHMLSPQCDDR